MAVGDVFPDLLPWATRDGGRVDLMPTRFAQGFIGGTIGSANFLNTPIGTATDGMLDMNVAWTNAQVTVPISPISDGKWVTYTGNLGRAELTANVFSNGAAPFQTVIARTISPPFNNTSGVVWTLTEVKMFYQFVNGAFFATIEDRAFGSPTWNSTGMGEFTNTIIGGETKVSPQSIVIDPTREYAIRLDMTTLSTPGDIEVRSVELTFNRYGIP